MAKSNLSNNQPALKICSVENCQNKRFARKMCAKHYARFRKYNNPLHTSLFVGKGNNETDRFWSKVAITDNKDECWEWLAGKHKFGYGAMVFDGKVRCSHVIAFYLANGAYPKNLVLHSCDNPRCCNPKHLRDGTRQDNVEDMFKRNRAPIGEHRSNSKVTETIVREIRQCKQSGESYSKICNKFSISIGCAWRIVNFKTWKHVI